MKSYHLFAHGYELTVREDSDGKWWGYIIKDGDPTQVEPIAGPGELAEIKLAICREAEKLAIVYGQSAVGGWTE